MIRSMFLSLLLVLQVFILSCSTPRPEGQTEAEVLFLEAKELAARKRYIMASEKLGQIRSQYPYSFFATHAELLSADILFEQGNYTEAAAAYILFRDFHPRHERIDYVVWRIAEAFYNQLPPTHDRDLTAGSEALRYYREIVLQFSSSDYVKEANEKIRYIEEMQQSRELYVADFYYKTKVYAAARFRYLQMIQSTSKKELVDHAMVRALESSYQLKEKGKCLEHYQLFAVQADPKIKSELEKIFKKCSLIKES